MNFNVKSALAGGGALLTAGAFILGTLFGNAADPVDRVGDAVGLSPGENHIAFETCKKSETKIVRLVGGPVQSYSARYETATDRIDLTWQVAELGKPIAIERRAGEPSTEFIDQAFLDCVAAFGAIPDESGAPHVH